MGQRQDTTALYPRKRHDTHCTGDWGDTRAGLDRCGKFHLHENSNVKPVASRYTAYATRPTLNVIIVQYFDYVFEALLTITIRACACHIFICSLSQSAITFHYSIYSSVFETN